MKKIIWYLVCILFTHQLNSQNFWAYTAGGIKEDETMDICSDNSGNLISVGYFSSQTDFKINPGLTLSPSSFGVPDIFILKSSQTGQVIWATKAGGSGSDRATSVKTDATGNIYITGYFYGTANFGSTVLSSASGSQDGFIAKLDANGNFLWAKSFGGNLAEWGNAVALDEFGNAIITGQFQGTTNFSGTSLTSLINPNTTFSSFDVFVAKYNPSGNLLWVNKGSSKYDDRGLDVITDNTNNIYVCGQFSDTIQFQNTHNNSIMNATFVIKYNALGQEQWFRKATGLFSIPYSMTIDNTQQLYIAGDFQGNFTFFSPSGNSNIGGAYINKAFLIKIDNSGNFIWGRSESSTNYVSAKRVSLDPQQNPYVFGEFSCTMNEYSDANGQGVFNSIGFQDLFITKYSAMGTRQWFKHFGGPGSDKAHGLLLSGIDEPVMAGSYERHLNIPMSFYQMSLLNNISASYNMLQQPSNYCSSTGNYGNYAYAGSKGYSDIFTVKGVDLNRNPYDYYTRSGSGCNLNFVGSCIEYTSLNSCPDTIEICDRGFIYANENASSSTASVFNQGPMHRYKWNNNVNDTLRQLFVTSSGYNTVNVKTVDGCYSSTDTVYVKVNPLPLAPVISDSYGSNILQPPLTQPVHICGPATLTLTGGNVNNTIYTWTGPYQSTHDSIAIVNSGGTYSFSVVDQNDCKNSNWIDIIIDSPLAPFKPIQKNDTVRMCKGNLKTHIICDSITNPALSYPYSCVQFHSTYIVSQSPGLLLTSLAPCDLSYKVSANATGNYTYTTAYIINNLCGQDTIFYTAHIHIIIDPTPFATIDLSGSAPLCPGDSTLLIAALSNLSSGNITYTISPNDSIIAIPPNFYTVSVNLEDTISGCQYSAYDSEYISVKPNPFIILNPFNAIICPNDSVQLMINLPNAINYEWHGPTGLISGNSQIIYKNTPGFYHCIVTDNSGCVFTTNTIEIKQYATPYLLSSPGQIICNNQPLNLHINTLDSTLILWNAPLSGSGATKLITGPGVYSCQVTMCGITTSLSINILGSNPSANITTFGSQTVCPFDSVLLSGNLGMSSYNWLPGNYPGQNFMVHNPGSYTLQVTDQYGCNATSSPVTISFTSNISPPASAMNDSICVGQSGTISVTGVGSNPVEWFMSSNNGPVIHSGTTYITPTLSTHTTYYAASVSPGGCHSIGIPVTVWLYPSSLPPVILADTTVCKHDSLKIYSPFYNGITYHWGGPVGSTNSTNGFSIADCDSTHSGVYTLQLSGYGCSSPTSTVHINVLNPLSPIISPIDSICEHDNYLNVVSNINSLYNYEWSGPGNFNYTGDSLVLTNISMNQSGTYTVSSNLFGCLSPASILKLTVLETPQTPFITSNTPCIGDTLYLSASPVSPFLYTWYNTSTILGTGNSIAMVSTDTSGGYYGVNVSNYFCQNSSFDLISVVPYPVTTVSNDTIACDNESLILSSSSNFPNYLWNTGSINSSISITESGTYWVSSQNGGCVKTDSIHVTLISCSTFAVNVFTPNGDGVNDVFMFKSDAILSIHCEITDRWGLKVGEFNGPENGWNGKNISNGKECSEGTYFYVANIKTIEGITKNLTGFLTLSRSN